jgi:hypothetical protein
MKTPLNFTSLYAIVACMAPDTPGSSSKPDLKLVTDNSSPEDIFNNMEELRKVAEHKVQRKSVQVSMTVMKVPPSSQHFQCHPDPTQHLNAKVVFDREERDIYFVVPSILNHPLLVPRLRSVTIATTCLWPSMQVGLWTVPFPTKGKGSIKCWKTARTAFEIAAGLADERILRGEFPGITVTGPHWAQLCWNDDKQDYDLSVAENINTSPLYQEGLQLSNSLKLGFREKTIADEDHSYMRQLRGLTD